MNIDFTVYSISVQLEVSLKQPSPLLFKKKRVKIIIFCEHEQKEKCFRPLSTYMFFPYVLESAVEFNSKSTQYTVLEFSSEKLARGCTTARLCQQHVHCFTCRHGFLMQKRRDLKKKIVDMAWNHIQLGPNHRCHPLLCLWPTFPHFLPLIIFISVNKQPKNHTTSYYFHYILFPPSCGFLWLKYIYYSSWKQLRKMALSVRQLLVQRDGLEPRTLFSRLQGWCQSF